jgi:hypothetical protein
MPKAATKLPSPSLAVLTPLAVVEVETGRVVVSGRKAGAELVAVLVPDEHPTRSTDATAYARLLAPPP